MAGWQKILTESNSATLTNKTHTSAVLNTGVSGTAILDEDDLVTDSNTKLATQQSIKAYVDSQDHAGNIAALTDTTITGASIGEVLIYNATTSMWVDAALTGTANEVDITLGDGTCQIGLPTNVTIGGVLTVTGNLDVNGTTTSINTTNLEISDTVMILHTGEVGVYAGSKADCGITFCGTDTSPVITEVGKLVWDYTGGNIYSVSDTPIGMFKIGTTNAISAFTDQNTVTMATQMPVLNCGGMMLDDASGAAYKATGTPVATQDGLMVWDGTDLYIYGD